MEACVASVSDHDMIVNLGDIVGYGASPNEVSDRSRELCDIFVRGNHDKACTGLAGIDDFNPIAGMAALWTQQTLTPENLEWLRALPQGPIELDHIWPQESENSNHAKVQCVHGSPLDEDEYITSRADAENIYDYLDSALTFFGHTHLQGGFLWANGHQEAIQRPGPRQHQVHLRLDRDGVYLLNPGSVGQPRDGDPRAAYALYDTESREVTFRRVQYDAFKVRQRIEAAGLPAILGDRLLLGR